MRTVRPAPAAALLVALAVVSSAALAGCSGSADPPAPRPRQSQPSQQSPDSTRGSEPTSAAAGAARPRLVGSAPCRRTPGFTCSTLAVPLDHGGRVPGVLRLSVAVADNEGAPRGVLLVLSGGPGQPGVSLVQRVRKYFDPAVVSAYRMVMFDQRGTGPHGIDCPELQAAVGGADFLTPPRLAVEQCAAQLGSTRDFYGTPDTVADIEWLRRALGVRRLTVDGTSYGTFSGAQYAVRHPSRVRSLVLDSVVPFDGFDPLPLDELAAARRVLADACRHDPSCTTDPVADLAWLVRRGRVDGRPINGTGFVEGLAIMSLSRVNPAFAGIPQLLHAARSGDTAPLAEFFRRTSSAGGPFQELSGGLHMATLCADLRFPWGTSAAPMAGRAAAVEREIAGIQPSDVYPYDIATARRVLEIQGCRYWPPSRPSAFPDSDVLTPRTLLLHGTHDLFCPLAWAHRTARRASNGTLVVVPGGGHGTQGSPDDATARDAVRDFLLG